MELIRILLVDDSAMARRSLAFSLQAFEDLVLVGEARHGAEALRLCAELQPDVVIIDLNIPGMSGLCASQKIRRQFPKINIVIFSNVVDESLVQAGEMAGVTAVLSKSVSIDEIANAVRRAKKAG